jgi:quinol monooxygenase YgiN
MNKNISWVFELTLKDGKLETLKELAVELSTATKENEPGTMVYEWTLSKDEKICHIYERYEDSIATLKHLKTFIEKFSARLMETGDCTSFVVYGEPSQEAKKVLDGFSPVYMAPIGGFIR